MLSCRNPHLLFLSLLLLILTGCAATLQSNPPLPGFEIKNIGKLDAGAPFAVNRSGLVAAVADHTLQLVDPLGGPARTISPLPATALAFSPSGERLAAAFQQGDAATLSTFDLQGKLVAETAIPARITALAWRTEKEVLATGLEVKRFRFGTELVSFLFGWDTVGAPKPTILSDITVRPKVGEVPEALLYRTVNLAVSPYGDEIAYYVLKDPPMFLPYLRVAVRHLETGIEREVAEVGVGSGGPVYTPDGESLLTGDARSLTRKFSLSEIKETDGWPMPGDHLALSPAGSVLFLDGRLYQGGQEVTAFPKETVGEFLADGSGMVLGYKGALFLAKGFREPQPPQQNVDLTRILELRRLHVQKLISDKEFKAQKAKVPTL